MPVCKSCSIAFILVLYRYLKGKKNPHAFDVGIKRTRTGIEPNAFHDSKQIPVERNDIRTKNLSTVMIRGYARLEDAKLVVRLICIGIWA